MAEGDEQLTVAITGPTGTFGMGLVPLLQADDRIDRIIGVARRPFDPHEHGWTKMEYRQGDVRDRDALRDAFEGADVVVHLAFLITGNAPREEVRAINIDGTINTFRAAVATHARRFVYASSVAAYGFHPDNPVPMTETWPARRADHFFYAQEKAELERLLREESAADPTLGMYVLRPPVVLGPHAVGAKEWLPPAFAPLTRIAGMVAGHVPLPLPVPLPVIVPDLSLQFIHEDDVGSAFVACICGDGPPGTYNIAGDGVLTVAQVAAELGLVAVTAPAGPVRAAARRAASLPAPPRFPPIFEWTEVLSHPAIMDTSKAKRDLGWTPRFSGLEALRSTLRSGASPDLESPIDP
jgi:nucleoside-diphosphate-sugar epimerase